MKQTETFVQLVAANVLIRCREWIDRNEAETLPTANARKRIVNTAQMHLPVPHRSYRYGQCQANSLCE
jgi:hypothetical protein